MALLIAFLLLQLTAISTSASSLSLCNCVTFNLDWYEQQPWLANVSESPFTDRKAMICCNSAQLSSIADLPPSELHQLTHQTAEVRLKEVASPLLLLEGGHTFLSVLHLTFYPSVHGEPTLIADNSSVPKNHFCKRLERFYLRESAVNVDLLDQLALNCHKLTTFSLERVRVTLVPDPAVPDNLGTDQATMHRQFNVLTQHFTSRNLRIFSLVSCQILTLAGFDLLADVSTLRMISLSKNHLTELESGRNFFPRHSPELWFIDLSYNKLRAIPMDWPFPNSLRVLKLDHNLFKVLQFDPFMEIWSGLNEFWVHSNIFDCRMMVQSEEWMEALMTVDGLRERPQEGFPTIGLDSWTCYHHNGTKRMAMLQLPVFLLNNQLDGILGSY